MMSRFSIKKQLIIYGFVIQLVILSIFSYALYKALEISTLDKMQSTLKVILLDIVDDILEHQGSLDSKEFDEEKEYKFEPLYIRLIDINTQEAVIINTTKYPSELIPIKTFKTYELNNIYFDIKEHYISSRIILHLHQKNYLLEVATNYKTLNTTLENFIYILIFTVPIILLFSTLGGYFLVYKSFLPIEQILVNLKQINATDLSKRLKTLKNHDEINQLSQEINALLTRLESSFEQVSQFSSDASHELKTPLTIIRGELEIALRKERSVQEYQTVLQTSLNEIIAIQQTVDELLFLAKAEQQLLDIQAVYLDEVCLEAVQEMQTYAKLKGVRLIEHIETPMQIQGHPNLLKVAIKNILKNAISFSHENSEVVIENSIHDDQMIILVSDRGIGIAKEEQKKVFETFYRTDKSRNKEAGGTGLGLAIVKKIVTLHHGKIEIQSEQNQGTSVRIIF